MKANLILIFILSSNLMAAEVVCKSNNSIQIGAAHMKTEAILNFDLLKNGNKSTLKNVEGHVFVKSPFEDEAADFSEEDSYRGYFKIDSLNANPDYRPSKYKGYAQFPKFNAYKTDGREDGMWGYLALDVSSDDSSFKAAYVFQAGDHMGGTVLFDCEEK